MIAAVLYGKEHLQVEPVAVPTIESGDLLVRVKVALTCGTDVKVFRRGYHARMIVPPAVFGHELAGDVVSVGPTVTKFPPGDPVLAAGSSNCNAPRRWARTNSSKQAMRQIPCVQFAISLAAAERISPSKQ